MLKKNPDTIICFVKCYSNEYILAKTTMSQVFPTIPRTIIGNLNIRPKTGFIGFFKPQKKKKKCNYDNININIVITDFSFTCI